MQGEFIVHENTTPLPTIHVVSDSVGLTAQALARAAAAQFGVTNPNIEVLPHVRSFEEVKQFIAEHGQLHKRLKGDENLLIFYTLVDGDLRRSLSDYCLPKFRQIYYNFFTEKWQRLQGTFVKDLTKFVNYL